MSHAPDATILLRKAADFVDADRPVVARPLLATLRRAGADPVAVATLSVRLEMTAGRPDAALAAIAAGWAAAPEEGRFYLLRADVRAQLGDVTKAMADAAEAVVRLPGDPTARWLLGVLLLRDGRPDEGMAVLAEAARNAPAHEGIARALDVAREMAEPGRSVA